MRTLGNIIWHIPFLGFVSAFLTFLVGGLFVITVIGAPIGLGLIQLAKCLLTPFSSAMINGKELQKNENVAWKAFSIIIRILYFPFGLILALTSIAQIIVLFVSIIGIPVALVLAKSLSTYFNPINKQCVSKAIAIEIEQRNARIQVDKHFEN